MALDFLHIPCLITNNKNNMGLYNLKLFNVIILLTILLVLIESCRNNMRSSENDRNENVQKINIDNVGIEEEISTSSIFRKVKKTIILETRKDVILSSISTVQIYRGRFYVLDNSKANRLFMFDRDGRFVGQISSPGGAPNEYVEIGDFTIDHSQGELYLLDVSRQKILKFDAVSGDFINSIKLKSDNAHSTCIQYANGRIYANNVSPNGSGDSYLVNAIDASTGNVVGRFLKASIYNKGWNGILNRENGFFFSRDGDAPKYTNFFTDSIMEFSKGRISPSFVFETNNRPNAKDIAGAMITPEITDFGDLDKSGKSYDIDNFVEFKNFVSFTYTKGGKRYYVFFNKKTKKVRIGKDFIDNLVFAQNPNLCTLSCAGEDGVYGCVPFYRMQYLIEAARTNLLSPDLDGIEKLKKLPEDSNPVIFLYDCV